MTNKNSLTRYPGIDTENCPQLHQYFLTLARESATLHRHPAGGEKRETLYHRLKGGKRVRGGLSVVDENGAAGVGN